jgi:PBP1b-binding outer membrane lipoprotein LpoB
MHNIFRKVTLLSLGGAALILSGCASTDAVQKAQSTADAAMTAAQHAQASADKAESSAAAAEQKADAAMRKANDNGGKIDDLNTKMMQHKGPRG